VIPLSPGVDVGVLKEKGGEAALALGLVLGDTLRVRLAGDVSSQQQHLLAAAGIGFDRQRLKAQGLMAEAAWSAPAARVLRAFVNARLDKARDRHLATTVSQDTAVTVQELLDVFQSGNTTTYRTTTLTTTTVTTTTTDQSFRGGKRQRLGAGLDLLLRPTTVGRLGLSHQRLSLPGLADQASTQGTLGLTEYFPEARANASLGLAVGSGSQGRLALAAQMALGTSPWLLNLNAWADTRGEARQHGVYAGVTYQFGVDGSAAGGAYNPGAVPQATRVQLDDRLRRMSTLSDGVRGVEGLGQVVKTESRTQAVSTETKVSERVVTRADETVPAVVQPVVETPVATSVAQPTVAAPPVVLPVVVDPDLVVPAGSGWALLPAEITVGDNLGNSPVGPIDAGGLTDTKNRAIVYQATGLPMGLSIDAATGVISGLHDSNGGGIYQVIVTAAAQGSSKSLTKTFTLVIQDFG
jgi:Putative Ig domain